MKNYKLNLYVRSLATVSLGVAVMVVASWLTVPFVINFSLQTMAVFIICAVLGFRKSTASLVIYILMGVMGLPVFSGCNSGIGPTGGVIIGFLLIPPRVALLTAKNKSFIWYVISMLVSIIPCYALGALWYGCFFAVESGVFNVLLVCVIPFLIPELIKILLSAFIVTRLNKIKLKL